MINEEFRKKEKRGVSLLDGSGFRNRLGTISFRKSTGVVLGEFKYLCLESNRES